MHVRTALALLVVGSVLMSGCIGARNMTEFKAALGFEPAEALPPEAPVARAMAFPTAVRVGDEIFFTAVGSGDPAGYPVVYTWNFNDGVRKDGAEVRHAYERPGQYRVELTVSNPFGLWDTSGVDVLVQPANAPPVVDIQVTDARGQPTTRTVPGAPLTLRALAVDPDGGALEYQWHFGDASAATEREARHAWSAPGRYTVTLRVTDEAGHVARATVPVVVDWRGGQSGVLAVGDPAAEFGFPGGPGESFEAVVAYDASLGAHDLRLRVLDADGGVLAESTLVPEPGTQGLVREAVVLGAADLASGEPGPWKVVVERVTGARVPYALTVELRY